MRRAGQRPLVVLALVPACVACEEEGPAERAGERLDEAAEEMAEEMRDAAEETCEEMEERTGEDLDC